VPPNPLGPPLSLTLSAATGASGRPLPFAAVSAEHRLEVDDRRPVERFETPHSTAPTVDRDHFDFVEADRVRTVGGVSVEHSLHRVGDLVARMHAQDYATVEPSENDQLIARDR
jgi:hypothetical protein